jgi:hypothetical protein
MFAEMELCFVAKAPAVSEEDWDAQPPHPSFTYGDRGFGPEIAQPTFNFGDNLCTNKSSVMVEASTKFRRRDIEARKEKAKKPVVAAERPFLSLETVKKYLEGGGNFKIKGEKTKPDPAVTSFLDVNRGQKFIGPHPAINKVVANIRKFRVMSCDTEGKEDSRKIYLIIGDLHGNVLLINNAKTIPPEIRELLEDVSIYVIQSNIYEDARLLEKVCDIKVVGLCDSQVIHGALVRPMGNLGTVAQARFCGHDQKKFTTSMNFNKGSVDHFPNQRSIDHATCDARQPFITLFKAAVMHAETTENKHVPLEPNDNVFNILWDVLNKCAGVPLRAVSSKGRPFNRLPEQNWKTGVEDADYNCDLNNATDVREIVASQKDWKPNNKKKPTAALRKLAANFSETRKKGMKLRRAAWKKKQWKARLEETKRAKNSH